MSLHDYFAELYVAGKLADARWNVYFPHRDEGFDFIACKLSSDGSPMIRPVQVKGKYPTSEKGSKTVYGYVGKLTQLHAEMILAIPYFAHSSPPEPVCVAYMPRSQIKRHSRGFRCQPAAYTEQQPRPRRDFERFFNDAGIALLESPEWSTT